MSNFICDSKTYNLSCMSSNCNILNSDPNYKSLLQFFIPDFISKDENIEYIQYSVPYCIIPNSFYNINASNNQLIVTFNSNTITYSFPYGNYNASLFMTTFRTIVDPTFSISLNSANSVFTITNTTYDFTFSINSTIDYIMGFSSTISSSRQTLTMTRCCNFLSTPRIIVRCNEINGGATVGEILSNNIIASIPNTAPPNGQIIFNPNNPAKTVIHADKISSLVISFTDDLGNLLNFNGLSCFFTIQIDTYRIQPDKLEPFDKIVKKVNLENIKRNIQSMINEM